CDEVTSFESNLVSMNTNHASTPQKILHKEAIKKDEWKTLVQKAVDQIKQDQAKKIVLAREVRVTLNKKANISNMLRKLIETQSNSYVFAFEQEDQCFIGASPERLVLIEGDQLL